MLKREADMLSRLHGRRRNCTKPLDDVSPALGPSPDNPLQVDDATLKAAMRRATVALKFVPVFMGSAYKNKVGYADGSGATVVAPTVDRRRQSK